MPTTEMQLGILGGLLVLGMCAIGGCAAWAQGSGASVSGVGGSPDGLSATEACAESTGLACLSPEQIAALQSSLSSLGLDPGPIDGVLGYRTLQALERFRRLAQSGQPGEYPSPSEVLRISRVAKTLSGQPNPSEVQIQMAALAEGISRSLVDAALPSLASAAALPSQLPPVPTRAFAGPGQFPPNGFRGYGFVAFPARASDFDLDRHMIICQAYLTSLPSTSGVQHGREDQFVTVWPLVDPVAAAELNLVSSRAEAAGACRRAIDSYDDSRSREVIGFVRQNDVPGLEGRGPFLFGWIPANGYGEEGELILMLDLSRVATYEQALTQLQSWQQKVETNPELLNDGFSIENLRRLVRDWSDQHGHAFLVLIGRG